MGMAASQARFLGLTARKNNVEFEGQQINQQRTALSNQTASYYTNLLGMNVPQPPSVQDFTKTIYSFTDGALDNQITSMIARSDGSFTISYLRNYTDDLSIVSAVPSRITKVEIPAAVEEAEEAEEGEEAEEVATPAEAATTTAYIVGGSVLNSLYNAKDDDGAYVEPKDNDVADDARSDEYWKSLSVDQRKNLLIEEHDYIAKLNAKYSQTEGGDEWLVKYTKNTTTGAYEPTFYNKSVLEGATYDDTNTSVSFIGAYKKGAAQVSQEIKGVNALLEQDSTGRYINITMEDLSGNLTTYALTTSTVTDDDAYNDAMNQYEYDKAQYDKDIQDINAKIEVIQAEDKNLELRLKQLDTEQDAISNEMDAVTKVVEKNVESSFKTFG